MNENIKLPYHLEAEQAILGIIFLESSQIVNVVERLEPEEFFNINHQFIFMAMIELYQQSQQIDFYTVSLTLKNKNQKIEGSMNYLIKLTNMIPSIHHLDTYIDLVHETALKRNIIKTASAIVHEGLSNHDLHHEEFLNSVEEKIFQISKNKKSNKFILLKDLLREVRKITVENKRDNNIIGLKTGYAGLDEITLGLKPEELIILAARPSMGKSSLMMNIAVNIAQENKNGKASVAIFSLEMSNEQLGSRMISAKSQISHKNIQLGILHQQQLKQVNYSIETLQDLNLYFDDSAAANILDIKSQCRQLKKQDKLDIVIIDYLQLIRKANKTNNQGFFNRQEEVSDISKSLKEMARELKIPVLALSQLSREVEKREDKRPILSDLRDSGSIEQDADIVMFLYRKHYYNKDRKDVPLANLGHTELIISKNRQGATGTKYFNLNLDYLLFKEIDIIPE
ncbi:MAG: replicative DNA helicase [Lettuce witches'-broom phytoplasma]